MAVKQSATWSPGAGKTSKADSKAVDDKLPTEKELAKAGEIEVLDKESQARKFSSLFKAQDGEQHKYLVVFIRHFFCGICQEYIRRLSSELPPSSLPPNTSVIIIGCGQPLHLARYTLETESVYPIYADPSRKLYQILRMIRTLDLGSQAPQYLSHTSMSKITLRSIWQELKSGRQMLTGGDYSQVGGEFIFDVSADGAVSPVWAKRMRNTRDHAELSEIKSVLGAPTKEMEEESSDSSSSPPSQPKPLPEESETVAALPAATSDRKKRWSSISGATGGIGRKLSKRGRTMSWQVGNSGSKAAATPSTAVNGTNTKDNITNGTTVEKATTTDTAASASSKEAEQEREVLEQLREEPEPQRPEGSDDALAKLMGAPSPAPPITETAETHLNGTAETHAPKSNGVPVEEVKVNESNSDALLNGVAAVKEEKRSALTSDITAYQKESTPEPAPAPAPAVVKV